jgi:hypothetical protein
MKYLITESQLNNAVFKYLDNQNFFAVEDRGDLYLWESESSWRERQYPLISTHVRYNDAYVSSELLINISDFFPVSLDDSLLLVREWFKYRYGFESMDRFYSDYGSD